MSTDVFDGGPGDDLGARVLEVIQALGPGKKLPPERDLSVTLGVSRTALRDRLRMFEAIGVLERRSGSGTHIALLSSESVARLLSQGLSASGLGTETFYRVRVALERESAGLAAANGSRRQFAALEEAAMGFRDQPSPLERFAVDLRFHRALLLASEDAGVQMFTEMLTHVLTSSVEDRSRRIERLSMPDVENDLWRVHYRIFEAVSARDVRAARDAVDYHFDWFDAETQAAERRRAEDGASR